MLFGLFDNYITTKAPSATRGNYLVIRVLDTPFHVLETLKKYMEEHAYTDVVMKEEYNDLFGIYMGFEVSMVVAVDEGVSLIQLSVYGEHKRGHVRSMFRSIYFDIENLFAGKIAKRN